ncbi:MAG: tRNA uridine-5-carboxymethylaminomethyl(34) synthesis GTPase MnmE [bacterium]|nr:tRNA uridine-5-carboxymethylaminomethyl(34) synthesis GTPase MnmE [bacterium]
MPKPDRKSAAASSNDTIAAIITPPGEGGIAALRLSGRHSLLLLVKHLRLSNNKKVKLQPFLMKLCNFVDGSGTVIDEVTAVYMPHGKSYTGLEQVELFCHGGRQVVKLILDELLAAGARAAEPGEFTRLAFENGRIDLTKAEAIAEIIGANTQHSYETARAHLLGEYSDHILQLRAQLIDLLAEIEASIDYPDEEIEPEAQSALLDASEELLEGLKELVESYRGGKIVREGFTIAIAGRPNSGKSSLFNLLLKQERALVTPTAGTTRDYLVESIDLDGYLVHLTDTAGLRKSGGKIEKAGQASAEKIIKSADLVLWLCDLTRKNWRKDASKDIVQLNHKRTIVIGNKSDLLTVPLDMVAHGLPWEPEEQTDSLTNSNPITSGGPPKVVGQNPQRGFDISSAVQCISCKTGAGIRELKSAIVKSIESDMPDLTSGIVVTSARHAQKLRTAVKSIKCARQKISQQESPELTAFDLREAASAIDEITGRIYNDNILDKIFSKFCIGK